MPYYDISSLAIHGALLKYPSISNEYNSLAATPSRMTSLTERPEYRAEHHYFSRSRTLSSQRITPVGLPTHQHTIYGNDHDVILMTMY